MNIDREAPGRSAVNECLKSDLTKALENDEFELYYQPLVDIRNGTIVGLEALIRWEHPQYGLIEPLNFILAAEENGLIGEIGKWVLRTACRQTRKWVSQGARIVPVSVNMSAHELEDQSSVDAIQNALKESGLPPKRLKIEVRETIALKETSAVVNSLKKLKRLGIGISIDDFGMAYSTLGYVKHMPIDTVKIDRFFIDGIGKSEKDEAITRTLLALVRHLGLNAVAEGVERQEQADFLAREGCYIVQGYYFYRPMPVEKVRKLLGYETESKVMTLEVPERPVKTGKLEISGINDFLDMMGISHKRNGYRYLANAIKLAAEDPKRRLQITDIYKEMAKTYKTTAAGVERSIRYVISPLGVTNKEFIAKAADEILNYNEYKPVDNKAEPETGAETGE